MHGSMALVAILLWAIAKSDPPILRYLYLKTLTRFGFQFTKM